MFETLTEIAVVARLPAASRAVALTECGPSARAVVFHVAKNGALVSRPPRGEPSTLNCTLSIPLVVSDALAASATLAPETVAPASGAVRETLGRPLSTVTGIDAMLITPLLFFATALRMCEPSEAVVLFQANMNGPDVSCEPMSLPSSWNCTLAMPHWGRTRSPTP